MNSAQQATTRMSTLFTDEEISTAVKNYLHPDYNYELLDKLKDGLKKFEVRDTDVFLIGYPKSGTTWAREMVWLILNDLDFKGAKKPLLERSPLFEFAAYKALSFNKDLKLSLCHTDTIEFLNNLKNIRCIKSHLSPEYLPEQLLTGEKKAKIIYIARNIKDEFLSSYHYSKNLLKVFSGNLDEYCKIFTTDAAYPAGNYWEQLLYFWTHRNEDYILFIRNEDMKTDLLKVIQTVAKFLNKTLIEEQEFQLIKWLDFDTMKKNPAVNGTDFYSQPGFLRTGVVGNHKKELPAEVNAILDIWIKEGLGDSDYKM